MSFPLGIGDPAPIQQSPTTCGSACLTVARMLGDPRFAELIRSCDREPCSSQSADERFAAHEQVVAARTNGLVGAHERLQPPWPRALGTPPWGARHELEHGAGRPGTAYAVSWLRLSGIRALGQAHDELCRRVRDGGPALLYVGTARLPRHVVLVLPGNGSDLAVYEPSRGRVVALPRQAFVGRRLGLGGWDVPWCLVWPRATG